MDGRWCDVVGMAASHGFQDLSGNSPRYSYCCEMDIVDLIFKCRVFSVSTKFASLITRTFIFTSSVLWALYYCVTLILPLRPWIVDYQTNLSFPGGIILLRSSHCLPCIGLDCTACWYSFARALLFTCFIKKLLCFRAIYPCCTVWRIRIMQSFNSQTFASISLPILEHIDKCVPVHVGVCTCGTCNATDNCLGVVEAQTFSSWGRHLTRVWIDFETLSLFLFMLDLDIKIKIDTPPYNIRTFSLETESPDYPDRWFQGCGRDQAPARN